MTESPQQVAIIGASFAGLFAAAAAARASAEVTLLERDRLDNRVEPRAGVPQGIQPHILLYRGLLTVERLLPGVEQDILDAGGLRIQTGAMPWLGPHGWSPTHLPSYDILSVSRPVLELVIRRRILQMPRVSLNDGFRVSEIKQTTDGWQVHSTAGKTVQADLLIDASGRSSRSTRWLTELGYPPAPRETVEAKLGYASRRYQGPEPPPLDTGLVIAATARSPIGCTILPVENRQWLVLLAGYGEHRPTRDTHRFADALAQLRDRAAADLVTHLHSPGEIAVYRQTGNRRVRYAQSRRWPAGLLIIGDALCAFNPIYGQGITVAAQQAELLGDTIATIHDVASTRRLQRRLHAVTQLPWSIATSEDLRQPTSSGRATLIQRLLSGWTDRMNQLATAGDPACGAAFTQVYHLIGSPRALFAPRVTAAVLRSYLRGVPPNLPRPAVLDRIATSHTAAHDINWSTPP